MFGFAAIYLMINPAKASYSMAPTMVVCALAGFLTAGLFAGEPRRRLMLAAAVGLLIGLSVNFRLPNLLLSAGYALFFLLRVPEGAERRYVPARRSIRHRISRRAWRRR